MLSPLERQAVLDAADDCMLWRVTPAGWQAYSRKSILFSAAERQSFIALWREADQLQQQERERVRETA